MNVRLQLLDEAATAVSRTEYGGPESSFRRIAELWTVWLANRGYVVGDLQAEDVAVMLMLMKVARLMSSVSHRDSIVDIAGYAACLAEIVEPDRQQ